MPVEYEIRPTIQCVVITLTGSVFDDELVDSQRALFNDPAFVGSYARLVDATDANLRVTSTTVRTMAHQAVQRGLTKSALVSGEAAMSYGMMRMYEAYASTADCEVFRDLGAAYQWLAKHGIGR